jgi:hypothetical protein
MQRLLRRRFTKSNLVRLRRSPGAFSQKVVTTRGFLPFGGDTLPKGGDAPATLPNGGDYHFRVHHASQLEKSRDYHNNELC